LPERRGSREREQQRQVGQDPIHHVDALIRIRQFDMNVQSAQQIALADHLQVVHHGVVALLVGLQGLAPERSRVSTGSQNGKAISGRDGRNGATQHAQLGARVRHVDMGRGDHLDLRLQKLG
jgi:hypothetical protein